MMMMMMMMQLIMTFVITDNIFVVHDDVSGGDNDENENVYG
jgi:hypothetical protein